MKKSFVLHDDSLDILDDMSNEQAGILIKAIKLHRQTGQLPELDFAMKMAIKPFISQFARDDAKYERIVERNKTNGVKGGRKKEDANPEEPKKPSGLSGNPKNPDAPDNDNDNDNDNVNDSDNDDCKEPPSSSSPNFTSYNSLGFTDTVQLFNTHKEYYYEHAPTKLNAEEQIISFANHVSTIRSDLIRVGLELYPFDTNAFLGMLKTKIQDSFNLLYRELKVVKDYSAYPDKQTALKDDLFQVTGSLLSEYKFKGFNEVQHVFNSLKGRIKKDFKSKSKTLKI